MAFDENEFEQVVQAAYDRLPDMYRDACRDLVIRTEALPAPEIMGALELSNPYELLGLYHGMNLANKSILDLPGLPDTIVIYREPIAAYAAKNCLPVEFLVQHVLVHEIGHHFGFSDADMTAIEER